MTTSLIPSPDQTAVKTPVKTLVSAHPTAANGPTINRHAKAQNAHHAVAVIKRKESVKFSPSKKSRSIAAQIIVILASVAVSISVLARVSSASDLSGDAALSNKSGQMRYERIISAGGSITEIIHALGLMDNVIAVDSSSLYPPAAHQLPKVGYFRSLGAEGLLSLSPDLLVAARGAGPSAVLNQVESSGVTVQQFEQSVYTLESWKSLISEVGNFFGKQDQANTLIATAIKNIETEQINKRYTENRFNAIALLNSGQRGPTAAGKDTMPDLLLKLAGINNLAGDLDGYKPYSTESLASKRLDLILVPHHNLDSMGGIKGICEQAAIKLATANGCNVQVVDALLLLGFGSRIDQAVTQIIQYGNDL